MKFKYFFSDFDGTLTKAGKLSKGFFKLLKLVEKNELELIIVSGRSASWGHFFLTHFPINYAIMESGGVILSEKKGALSTQSLATKAQLKLLEQVEAELQKKFPQLVMAQDNLGRLTDRAIELSSFKNNQLLQKVEAFLEKTGCNYSVSNVHLNFTTLQMDKWIGVKYFAQKYLRLTPEALNDVAFFMGDSLNDEVMFRHMNHSFAVENIAPYIDKMKYKPKHIVENQEIKGVLGALKRLSKS